MKTALKWCSTIFVFLSTIASLSVAQTNYLIANDDTFPNNSATIYSIGTGGALTLLTTIPTGNEGASGGDFAIPRVSVLRSKAHNCAYVGDAIGGKYGVPPGDVAAIDMSTLTLAGTYPGFALDNGMFVGVGLAEDPSGSFLFADYTYSATITTYKQFAGCKLQKQNQIITVGAKNGAVSDMKVTPNGKYLIVAYADGSIGSYNIDPSSGALTLINRYLVADGGIASGLDITSDSKWALFGVSSTVPTVEVAEIGTDGTLGKTVGYSGIGTGVDSSSIWLSPNEGLIYISNNDSGQITAAPFNKSNGAIAADKACTSPALRNFNSTWKYMGAVVGTSAGAGSPLYAPEFGYNNNPSGIAIVNLVIKQNPLSCRFVESSTSPVQDPVTGFLLSVGVDPPRNF